MARPPVSALPREMLQQILLRLPTEDILRCSCVCALWRRVAEDASFRALHTASHVAADDKDHRALLVSEKCGRRRAEASVFDVSSGKPMCGAGIVANPTGYRLANVCSGFLCFAHSHDVTAPVVVCNPVTGDKTELPEAPPLAGGGGGARRHLFLLGCSCSLSTDEYKLFRLSYPDYSSRKKYLGIYSTTTTAGCPHDGIVDVCTLGDGRGWRQHPYLFPHRPVDDGSPPVLVDGMLYVVMCRGDMDKRPDTVLQIDVASELHWTVDLPDFEDTLNDVRVNVFELGGQPCLAVNTVHWCRPKLVFWVTAVRSNGEGYWHPRYSFYLDDVNLTGGTLQYDSYSNLPRGAWVDNDDGETLCYRVGDTLYKYDAKGYYSPRDDVVGFLSTRDRHRRRQLQLPAIDQSPSTDRRWNICGGFRPTLLSPRTFALPAQEQFEQALLRTLHSDDSKRRRRRTHCNEPAAKRIC